MVLKWRHCNGTIITANVRTLNVIAANRLLTSFENRLVIGCTDWIYLFRNIPDNKVHWVNMGPTWVLSSPGGPHVGPMNLAIWDDHSRVSIVADDGLVPICRRDTASGQRRHTKYCSKCIMEVTEASNLPCDWPSTAWAYSEQETANGPRYTNVPSVLSCHHNGCRCCCAKWGPGHLWIII